MFCFFFPNKFLVVRGSVYVYRGWEEAVSPWHIISKYFYKLADFLDTAVGVWGYTPRCINDTSSTTYLLFNLGKLLICSMPQYFYHKMQIMSNTLVVSYKYLIKLYVNGLVQCLAYSKCSISGIWCYSKSCHCPSEIGGRLRVDKSEQRMKALKNRNGLHILAI